MILSTPVNGFIGCAAAIGNYDIRPILRGLDHRILFLVGDKDVTAAGIMRGMHEALPNSRYAEIANAGHISNIDQPAEFTRAIEAFLMPR
jgi:3-oxoadipate enol-lactonase